jgi:hypothetical protein
MLLSPYIILYIDESGNSGEVSTHEEHLRQQPYFVLAAVGVPANQADAARSKIKELKTKHRIHADELKSGPIYKKKAPFILELVQTLYNEGYPIFAEIMDKRYYLSMMISEWTLLKGVGLEHEILDHTNTPIIRPRIVGFLCHNLAYSTFAALCEACIKPGASTFEQYIEALISDLRNLGRIYSDAAELMTLAEFTQRHYKELIQTGDPNAHEHFLPEPDPCGGRDVRLLPHIYAMNHICARAEKYRTDLGFLPVAFVHDMQHAYSAALLDNFEAFKSLPPLPLAIQRVAPRIRLEFPSEASLRFEDSKSDLLIQAADVIAGTIGRSFAQWDNNEALRDEHWKINRLLGRYPEVHPSLGVNYVAPHSKIHAFLRVMFP